MKNSVSRNVELGGSLTTLWTPPLTGDFGINQTTCQRYGAPQAYATATAAGHAAGVNDVSVAAACHNTLIHKSDSASAMLMIFQPQSHM